MENVFFEEAERNKNSAKSMVKSKHNDWALFVWHLSLEKLLKGVLLHQKKEIPFIHNLSKIALQTGLIFSEEQLNDMDEITSFNLEARYDSYKYAFYKKANEKYTKVWDKKCENLYNFIKGGIKK